MGGQRCMNSGHPMGSIEELEYLYGRSEVYEFWTPHGLD
jgi:hypothetical protein